MQHAFELSKACRQWGDHYALRDLTLNIRCGEIVALIGPSGSGKSTLIRLLAGALKPTAGVILADGQNIQKLSPSQLRRHRAKCRIVEQTHMLVPQLSVHQNVIAGQLSHWPWLKVSAAALWPLYKASVQQLLQSLSIAEHQWKLASQLSGGQMQRVAIARALAAEPSIILADEPTASLDPVTAQTVTEMLVRQAEQRGITLIFCTHWLDNIMPHCDRIIGLHDGRLLLDGAPSSVSSEALDHLYSGSNERI